MTEVAAITVAPIDCSIVIPAWNASDFIGSAIRSALDQKDLKIEVLVVDDASQDDTATIVNQIKDDRLHLLRRARNGGAAAARNDGFTAATGRWIAVLDADDQFEPDRLSQLVREADRLGSDIIADNLWSCDGQTRTLHIREPLDGGVEEIDLAALYRAAVMFAGGREYGYLKPLFRRGFLQAHVLRYDTGLAIGEDFQLVAECLARGARYHRLRRAGYVYNRRVGSLSHRLTPGQLEAISTADTDVLNRFGERLTPVERAAVWARRKSVNTAAAFNRIVHAFKRRALAEAVREAADCPEALLLFRLPISDRIRRMRTGR
jgi:succinoglycan biosynthesis protein ExoO